MEPTTAAARIEESAKDAARAEMNRTEERLYTMDKALSRAKRRVREAREGVEDAERRLAAHAVARLRKMYCGHEAPLEPRKDRPIISARQQAKIEVEHAQTRLYQSEKRLSDAKKNRAKAHAEVKEAQRELALASLRDRHRSMEGST